MLLSFSKVHRAPAERQIGCQYLDVGSDGYPINASEAKLEFVKHYHFAFSEAALILSNVSLYDFFFGFKSTAVWA